MTKDEIDDIIITGGSSRIPKIQELVSDFFDGKQFYGGINPDEVSAYGAAVQGGILGGEESESTKDILLIDLSELEEIYAKQDQLKRLEAEAQ